MYKLARTMALLWGMAELTKSRDGVDCCVCVRYLGDILSLLPYEIRVFHIFLLHDVSHSVLLPALVSTKQTVIHVQKCLPFVSISFQTTTN